MSDNPTPVRKRCSLQEALEVVGKCAFPAEWTGHEADPLHGKDFATLRRCVRSTRALLALLHDGRVTAWFIPAGSTLEEQRQEITPSAWPDPAGFLARPPFGDLWFDLVSSRGALKPKPEDSPGWYQRFRNTPLWHVYSPLTGRIELDQKALRLATGDGTGQATETWEEKRARQGEQDARQGHDAQPSTPTKAEQVQTDDDLKDWFVDIYVPAHKDDSPNPTRDAALSAAKREFANYCDKTHLRDDLRKIWRDHAPKGWKTTGPRAKTE